MKKRYLQVLLTLFLITSAVFISGCTDSGKNYINSTNSATTTQLSPEEEFNLSYQKIPVSPDIEELLLTNGSYVAEIALKDNKAQQLLRHGGVIRGIDFRFTPCPKYPAFCLSSYPKLIIDYENLEYQVSVNETSGDVTGGEIDMQANHLDYSKVTFGETRYYFNGTKIILASNNTYFIFPDTKKGVDLQEQKSKITLKITQNDFSVSGNITSDLTSVISLVANSSKAKTLLKYGWKPISAKETRDDAYNKRILIVLTFGYKDFLFSFAADENDDFVRYQYPENVSYDYSDKSHRYTSDHDNRMENWWVFDKQNNDVIMIFNRTEIKYLNTEAF